MPNKDEVTKEYDRIYKENPNKWSNTDRSDFMINILKDVIPNPKHVIDVGCGSGVALENYKRYNPLPQLYGTDFSEEALRLAKEKVPDGIFTIENNFDSIKKFDLVLCLGVAEHVEELLEFLKSLKAKVRKNGFCYFEVPHNLLYSRGSETYRRLETRSRQLEWHFQHNKWEELLIEAGFEIVSRHKGLNPTWEFIWVLK